MGTNCQLVSIGTHCFTFHVLQIANWYPIGIQWGHSMGIQLDFRTFKHFPLYIVHNLLPPYILQKKMNTFSEPRSFDLSHLKITLNYFCVKHCLSTWNAGAPAHGAPALATGVSSSANRQGYFGCNFSNSTCFQHSFFCTPRATHWHMCCKFVPSTRDISTSYLECIVDNKIITMVPA